MRGLVYFIALGLLLIGSVRGQGECKGEYEIFLDSGCHRGIASADGKLIRFSNIPYAAPPDNPTTRFTWPQPPNYREGVHEDVGTRKCPQALPGWASYAGSYIKDFFVNVDNPLDQYWLNPLKPDPYGTAPPQEGDEDCLYLDVVVPKSVWVKKNPRAPLSAAVVVWIHGGGFVLGSKHDKVGAEGLFTAATDDINDNIVFVSINYRLGMFGWMGGTQIEEEEGDANLGLYDQIEALRWVGQNIYKVGGDARRITVMGQSGGGASIMHHLTYRNGSEYYPPVFKKAIILSPGFFPLPNDTDNNALYTNVLEKAGAKDLSALKKVPAEKLLKLNRDMVWSSLYGRFTFGPTVPSYTTSILPGQLLKEGKFHKGVQYLLGYTGLDGLLFTPPWIQSSTALKKFMSDIYPGVSGETLDKIIAKYPVPPKEPKESGRIQRQRAVGISNMINDLAIRCNIYFITEAAKTTEEKKAVYRYIFNVIPPVHGADLNYAFYPNKPFNDAPYVIDPLAKQFQQDLVDFIRYSNANREDRNDWQDYTNDRRKVVNIGHMGNFDPEIKYDFKWALEDDPMTDQDRENCEFWRSAPFYQPRPKSSASFVDQSDPSGLEL